MLTIFASTFMTATRQPDLKRWDAPAHWRSEALPVLRASKGGRHD